MSTRTTLPLPSLATINATGSRQPDPCYVGNPVCSCCTVPSILASRNLDYVEVTTVRMRLQHSEKIELLYLFKRLKATCPRSYSYFTRSGTDASASAG